MNNAKALPSPDSPLLEHLSFQPTQAHQKAKSALLVALQDSPHSASPEKLSLSEVERLSGNSQIRSWWSLPGFQSWFLNTGSWRVALDYASQIAIDTCLEIMQDREANPSARVNASKLILEASGKMPKKVQEKYADQQISRMGKEELQSYLRKHSKLLEGVIGVKAPAQAGETPDPGPNLDT